MDAKAASALIDRGATDCCCRIRWIVCLDGEGCALMGLVKDSFAILVVPENGVKAAFVEI